jgi:hypothetical protein
MIFGGPITVLRRSYLMTGNPLNSGAILLGLTVRKKTKRSFYVQLWAKSGEYAGGRLVGA